MMYLAAGKCNKNLFSMTNTKPAKSK